VSSARVVILASFAAVWAPAVFANPALLPDPELIALEIIRLPDDPQQISCAFSDQELELLEKLNRVDRKTLLAQKQVVAPREWGRPEEDYSPLPNWLDWADQAVKTLLVHKPLQAFAAYENGRLVRWGPVSTGAARSPTPSGFFHLNWRSKGHRSTVNQDWFMPWYFNFNNRTGYSFHEFELPGGPASHGCVRLLGRDARWIYDWGASWTLDARGWKVTEDGTPVLIIGEYPHENETPPWRDPELLESGFAAAREGRWLSRQALNLAGMELAEPIEGAPLE
jgi:hypothetical protein